MIRLLSIDPALRYTGLVLLSPRGIILGNWTVRCTGRLQDVVTSVNTWIGANDLAQPITAAIELPPPRIHDRTYRLEPALTAGVWLHALMTIGIWVDVIPAWEWQKAMLGPKKDWPGGDSKAMCNFRCKGEGISLSNSHTRDAYQLGRYVLKRNRISSLLERATNPTHNDAGGNS